MNFGYRGSREARQPETEERKYAGFLDSSCNRQIGSSRRTLREGLEYIRRRNLGMGGSSRTGGRVPTTARLAFAPKNLARISATRKGVIMRIRSFVTGAVLGALAMTCASLSDSASAAA